MWTMCNKLSDQATVFDVMSAKGQLNCNNAMLSVYSLINYQQATYVTNTNRANRNFLHYTTTYSYNGYFLH